jgi:hypothetical protein
VAQAACLGLELGSHQLVLARGALAAEAEEGPADWRVTVGSLEGVPHGLARFEQLLPDAGQEL